MRIAVLIIGLVFAVLCGMQSFLVSMLGTGLGEKATESGGSLGMIVALFLLLGAAFALNLPLIATTMFGIGGLMGTMGGYANAFPDLAAWGWVSLVLAFMSLVAVLIKRRAKKQLQVSVQ